MGLSYINSTYRGWNVKVIEKFIKNMVMTYWITRYTGSDVCYNTEKQSGKMSAERTEDLCEMLFDKLYSS